MYATPHKTRKQQRKVVRLQSLVKRTMNWQEGPIPTGSAFRELTAAERVLNSYDKY